LANDLEHTLGKNERLKSRKQIDQLFKDASSFTAGFLKVYHQLQVDAVDTTLQFGTGVGKRHFKKAVHRNRIKRLIREAWRLNNTLLKNQLNSKGQKLNVFIIFTGKELPVYEAVVEYTKTAIERLQKLYL
jgi:ribonuclease P protein component